MDLIIYVYVSLQTKTKDSHSTKRWLHLMSGVLINPDMTSEYYFTFKLIKRNLYWGHNKVTSSDHKMVESEIISKKKYQFPQK